LTFESVIVAQHHKIDDDQYVPPIHCYRSTFPAPSIGRCGDTDLADDQKVIGPEREEVVGELLIAQPELWCGEHIADDQRQLHNTCYGDRPQGLSSDFARQQSGEHEQIDPNHSSEAVGVIGSYGPELRIGKERMDSGECRGQQRCVER
jgi:hypothetical protein